MISVIFNFQVNTQKNWSSRLFLTLNRMLIWLGFRKVFSLDKHAEAVHYLIVLNISVPSLCRSVCKAVHSIIKLFLTINKMIPKSNDQQSHKNLKQKTVENQLEQQQHLRASVNIIPLNKTEK